MRSWRAVAVLLLSLALVGSTACSPFGDGSQEETSQQLVEVVRGDLILSVSGSGNIVIADEANLAFGTSGRIDKIFINEGDEVAKGEVVARLDTAPLELALTQAQASLAQARIARTQTQIAQAEAQAALTRARASLAQARIARTQTQIAQAEAQAALTQAQAALTQAQVALTQAQVALAQAQAARTQAQIALNAAEDNLDKAEDYLDRLKRFLAKSDLKVERAESQFEAAKLQFEAAGLQLEAAELQLEAAELQLEIAESQPEAAELQLEIAESQFEIAEPQLEVADLQIEAAELQLEIAESQFEIAEPQLEVADLQLEAAEQALEEAQKQLDRVTITAPFDGAVISVDANEGDSVSAMTTIIHLIDLTSIELEVEVDEIDIAEVKLGQRAIIEVDALPALQLEGKVTSIPLLSKETGGLVIYEVTIGFDVPQDYNLKIGMSAIADIVIDERSNVLLVPNRAITQDSQGNPIVKVMVDEEIEEIEERPVVLGISDGFQIEIVDGLNEEDVVVIETKVKSSAPGLF